MVVPIITAICIYALRSIAAGERPRAGQALVSGFEAFTPLFFAVLIAAIGIAAGFVLLVIPGIYLAVQLFFVPQTVVIEGARGLDALRASSDMVQRLLVAHLRPRGDDQPGGRAARARDHRALHRHRRQHRRRGLGARRHDLRGVDHDAVRGALLDLPLLTTCGRGRAPAPY